MESMIGIIVVAFIVFTVPMLLFSSKISIGWKLGIVGMVITLFAYVHFNIILDNEGKVQPLKKYSFLNKSTDKKRPEAASFKWYNPAEVQEPIHVSELVALGNKYFEQANFSKAVSYYDNALGLDPNNLIIYNNRGTSYFQRKFYNEAIGDFTTVLNADPLNSKALLLRGNCYSRIQSFRKAISDLEKGLELEFEPNRSFYAFEALGFSYEGIKDYGNAIDAYNKAIELYRSSYVFNNRGITWSRLGEYDKAIADINSALEIDPNNAVYQKNLIEIKEKQEYPISDDRVLEALNKIKWHIEEGVSYHEHNELTWLIGIVFNKMKAGTKSNKCLMKKVKVVFNSLSSANSEYLKYKGLRRRLSQTKKTYENRKQYKLLKNETFKVKENMDQNWEMVLRHINKAQSCT